MGKKKQKTTSTETIGPSAYAQPYIDAAAGANQEGYRRSMGLLDQYQPQFDESIDYYGSIANGGYQQNPYLDGILERTRSNVMNDVGGQFSSAGRYGSAMNQDVMVRAMADQENQLRYQDYSTQQGRMDDAAMRRAGLIESLVQMPQGISGNYANATGGLLGRYLTSNGTSKTTSSGGLLGTLGQIAQIGATVAMASDERLKVDVTKIGEAPDGLGEYAFRYVTDAPDAPLRTGVMAQEVEKLRPWALGPERGGFKTVNYGAL